MCRRDGPGRGGPPCPPACSPRWHHRPHRPRPGGCLGGSGPPAGAGAGRGPPRPPPGALRFSSAACRPGWPGPPPASAGRRTGWGRPGWRTAPRPPGPAPPPSGGSSPAPCARPHVSLGFSIRLVLRPVFGPILLWRFRVLFSVFAHVKPHVQEQKGHPHGDAAVGHVEHGELHEGGLEHVGDKTKDHPVDQITHASRQHQGGGEQPQAVFEEAFDDEGAHGQHHHCGGEGEQPGVGAQHGEGRAGVLHVGQVQQIRDEGHIPPQGDDGADQIFHNLVEDHQSGGQDGVKHGISLSLKVAIQK